MAIGNEIGN
jgi:hypothetical protein